MGSMEVSGANMRVGDNGGNVGLGVARPPSPSRPQPHQPSRPRPRPPSRLRPRQSTLPLLLSRMGYIRTQVNDIGGLMDGSRGVDAS